MFTPISILVIKKRNCRLSDSLATCNVIHKTATNWVAVFFICETGKSSSCCTLVESAGIGNDAGGNGLSASQTLDCLAPEYRLDDCWRC